MIRKKTSKAMLSRRQTVIADHVRHASNPLARMKGLLGSKSLAAGHGLWLRPCSSIHTVGMSFPIDVLFLDKHRKIVRAAAKIKPMRICWAPLATRSVLELPEGTIARYSIQAEEQVEFIDVDGTEAH